MADQLLQGIQQLMTQLQQQMDQSTQASTAAQIDVAHAQAAAALAVGGAAGPAGADRASRKPPTFESGDAIEWMTFIRAFTFTVMINNWNENRAKRELAAAMKGKAARVTSAIEVENPVGGPVITYEVVKDAYAALFIPPAASDIAVSQFEACRQWADEDLMAWHARCRDLFTRAYPGLETNPSRQLISRYCQGLATHEVKDYVFTHRPATYTDALQYSQNRVASLSCMVNLGPAPTEAESQAGRSHGPKISAIGTGPKREQNCWHCKQLGHIQRSCPTLQKKAKADGLTIEEAMDKYNTGKKKVWKKKRSTNYGNDTGKWKKKGVHAVGDAHNDDDSDSQSGNQ